MPELKVFKFPAMAIAVLALLAGINMTMDMGRVAHDLFCAEHGSLMT